MPVGSEHCCSTIGMWLGIRQNLVLSVGRFKRSRWLFRDALSTLVTLGFDLKD